MDEIIFYVDIPRMPTTDTEDQEFQNVAEFKSWEAALAFAKDKFGTDDDGKIELITPNNPKYWKK
jgi:hypothetical protein